MNVLLVSANTETVNMPVLPLGMAFVARAAQEAGHHVSQVNLMAEEEGLSVLADRIEQDQPDVIGISVRNIDDQCASRPRFLLDAVAVKVSVGIRIYPDTPLARHARRTGAVAGDDSLLFPRFYVEAGMEGWIRKTVEAWIKDRPGWIY